MIQSEKRRGDPSEHWQQAIKKRNEHIFSVGNFGNITRVNMARDDHSEFLKSVQIKQHFYEPAPAGKPCVCVDTTVPTNSYRASSLPFSTGETSINS